MNFDKWEEYDEMFNGERELSYKLYNINGMVQYNPLSNNLYIWSGIGRGSYHCRQEHVDEDNSCYGFRLPIENMGHLRSILETLGFEEDEYM